jgi:hypothetical protein
MTDAGYRSVVMAAQKRGLLSRLPFFAFLAIIVLGVLYVFLYPEIVGYLVDAKTEIARTKAKMISEACKAYRQDHDNRWPDKLELLVNPDNDDKAYLEDMQELLDPWDHQQFQYDPSGPHNKGRQPDIWTTTPKGKVIGNW